MFRSALLVMLNLTLALVLAISVMPLVLVTAPAVRAEPAAGYTVFALSTAAFVAVNAWLWRRWRRR